MWKPTAPVRPGGLAQPSNLQSVGGGVFGLQLPKSKAGSGVAGAAGAAKPKPKAFSMDDDEEESAAAAPAGPVQLASIRAQKYAREAAKVLAENPDAFAYDELFEDDHSMRKRQAVQEPLRLGAATGASGAAAPAGGSSAARVSGITGAPRYIEALLNKSAARKLEAEAIYERSQLRARAQDDEEHADKEKFVTAAFREKIAAQEALRAQQEEQDRRDEAAERLRAKGGAGGTSLAMQASRAILNSRAGISTPAEPAPAAHAAASTASTTEAASSTSAAVAPRSSGSKHPRDEEAGGSSAERDSTRSVGAWPESSSSDSGLPSDAKRARTAEHDAAASSVAPASTAASDGASSQSGASAAAALPVPAAEDIHTAALVAVATRLCSIEARRKKIDEARERMLARRQAAGVAS